MYNHSTVGWLMSQAVCGTASKVTFVWATSLTFDPHQWKHEQMRYHAEQKIDAIMKRPKTDELTNQFTEVLAFFSLFSVLSKLKVWQTTRRTLMTLLYTKHHHNVSKACSDLRKSHAFTQWDIEFSNSLRFCVHKNQTTLLRFTWSVWTSPNPFWRLDVNNIAC